MDKNIQVKSFDKNLSKEILEHYSLSKMSCDILASRLVSIEQVDKFLNPCFDRDFDNPFELSCMVEVVNRVSQTIKEQKRILIYGDFDFDGMSATAILLRAFNSIKEFMKINFEYDYFIPSRIKEGYGITEASIERLVKTHKKPDLIITVDCGISCKKEIEIIKSYGVDVVVTDHHEASGDLPDVAWVNPKVAKDAGFENLAGVAVALKFAQALCGEFGLPYEWTKWIDIAALGTIADVMPLLGSNRSLVKKGIENINKNCRYSFSKLLKNRNNTTDKIKAIDLSFSIIPYINSCGRMDKPELGVEFLASDNQDKINKLTTALIDCNNQRKQLTNQVYDVSLIQANQTIQANKKTKVIFIVGENFYTGVTGIVASKLTSKFKVPVFVFSIQDNLVHCSARSVGNINIHDAIMSCSDLFLHYGGHKLAIGCTLDLENLVCVKQSLLEYFNGLSDRVYCKSIVCDLECKLSDFTLDNVGELSLLEPCGQDNKQPIFLVKNVFIKNAKAIGKEKNHLQCVLTDGNTNIQAVKFNCDNISKMLELNKMVDVCVKAEIDSWAGNKKAKLYIEDIVEPDITTIDIPDELFFITNEISNNTINSQTNSKQLENSNEREDIKLKELSSKRQQWVKLAKKSSSELLKLLSREFIGQGCLHESQKQVLNLLNKGKNVLAVLPTGRGKSLIFQLYAAISALKYSKASVFVYPLRALIADQAYHLEQAFSKFGIRTCVLSGQTPLSEREGLYNQLKEGKIDIVLTTPEFLSIHIDCFEKNHNIGFLVIDEAHHIGEVKTGQRVAYSKMPEILTRLKSPQVLALSATITDDVFKDVKKYLPIDEIVTDHFERKNLYIDDKRNTGYKNECLTSIIASGQKTICYVNSRVQCVTLARMVRSSAPQIAAKIGFYNAGMSKKQRKLIEDYFREDKLNTIFATSAFGEGVSIPDVRHIVLYHVPFSATEFTQMCGRAGRDGNPSLIHLIYNSEDVNINSKILNLTCPNKDDLKACYLFIKNETKNNRILKLNDNILKQLEKDRILPAKIPTFQTALDIFEELNLIKHEQFFTNGDNVANISINTDIIKVDLEQSPRFVEAQNQILDYQNFKDRIMNLSKQKLTDIIRYPITPKKE